MKADWLTFCCVLIDKKVFDKIGLLDERFRFMFEDVDFCKRASDHGFRIECVEDAVVCHKISLRPRLSPFRIYWKLRGSWLFFDKHYCWRGFVKYVKNSIMRKRK